MDKIPFIKMLYTVNGERKEYNCDFPQEFIRDFGNVNHDDYEIAFFFVMGNDQANVKTISDAIKVCKG